MRVNMQLNCKFHDLKGRSCCARVWPLWCYIVKCSNLKKNSTLFLGTEQPNWVLSDCILVYRTRSFRLQYIFSIYTIRSLGLHLVPSIYRNRSLGLIAIRSLGLHSAPPRWRSGLERKFDSHAKGWVFESQPRQT